MFILSFGKRLKELRVQNGLTMSKLAEMAGVSTNTVYRWEAGDNTPNDKTKMLLVTILNTTISYLMGESEEPTRVSKPRVNTYVDWVEVPVLDPSAVACAGFGNGGMDGIVAEAGQFIALPQDWLGPIGEHRPFIISVEGDSMEEANIPAGSKIAINPEAEIYNGDPALVCFGLRNEWAVKWVYWQRDGGLELRSASPNYPPRYFSQEEIETNWCRIIGKVMTTLLTPKKGM